MSRISIPILHCPSMIRDYADYFKDYFSLTQYRAFVAFLCGCIFAIAGCSNIFRYLMFSPSVSSLNNFLNSDLSLKINRRHRRRLKKMFEKIDKDPNRYFLAIDDSLIPHFGENIWGAYWWSDHGEKYVFGHKLMVIGLVDRKNNVLIPLIWEVLHRELYIPPNMKYEKAWEVSLRLLETLADEGLKNLPVVADSWFAGEEFFSALDQKGYNFCIELKCNRKIVQHRKKQLDVSLTEFFEATKRKAIYYHGKKKLASEATVKLKNAKCDFYKVCAISNSNSDDKKPFAYYCSNKLTWDCSKLWGLSRDRWTIEVQFRDLKQLFTLGEAAVRSKSAVETTISLSAIALTVIRLKQIDGAESHRIGNQNIRPVPAGEIVRDLQLKSMFQSISRLATNTAPREKLKQRLNKGNFCQKPVDFRRKKRQEKNERTFSFKNLILSAAEKIFARKGRQYGKL